MFNTVRVKTEIQDDCLDGNQLELGAKDVVVKIEKPDYQSEGDNVKTKEEMGSGIDNDVTIPNNFENRKNNVQLPESDDLSVFCVPIYANFTNKKLNYVKREANVLNNEELIEKDVLKVKETNDVKGLEKKLYECSKCDFTTDNFTIIETHENSHCFNCPMCKYPCKSEVLLENHLKAHPHCDQCSFITLSEFLLKLHKRSQHETKENSCFKDQKNYISPVTIVSLRDSKTSYSKQISHCDNNLTETVSSTIKRETIQPDETENCEKILNVKKEAEDTLDSTPQTIEVSNEINYNSNENVLDSKRTNVGLENLDGNNSFFGTSILVGNSVLAGTSGLVSNSGFVSNLGLIGNLGLVNCNSLGVYYLPSKISEAERAILARYRPIAANPKPTSSPNLSANPNPNLSANPQLSSILSQNAYPIHAINPNLDFEKEFIKWKHSCKQCQYLTNNNYEFQKHLSFKYIKCDNCTSTFHAHHELLDHDCVVKRNQKAKIVKIVSVSKSTEPLKIVDTTNKNPYAGSRDISIIPDIIEEDDTIEVTKKSTIDTASKIKIEPSSSCLDSDDEYDTESDDKSSCDEQKCSDIIFKCMMCEKDFETENDLTFHNCGQFNFNNTGFKKNNKYSAVIRNDIKPVKHGKRKTPHEKKSCYELEYDDDGLYDAEQIKTIFTKNNPPNSKIRVLEEMRKRIREKTDTDFSEDEEIRFSDSLETIDSDDSEKPIYQITFDDSDEDAEPFDCEVTTEPFDCEVTAEPVEINSD